MQLCFVKENLSFSHFLSCCGGGRVSVITDHGRGEGVGETPANGHQPVWSLGGQKLDAGGSTSGVATIRVHRRASGRQSLALHLQGVPSLEKVPEQVALQAPLSQNTQGSPTPDEDKCLSL